MGAVEHTKITGREFGFSRTIVGDTVSGVIDNSPADPPFTNGEQGYYDVCLFVYKQSQELFAVIPRMEMPHTKRAGAIP